MGYCRDHGKEAGSHLLFRVVRVITRDNYHNGAM